MTRGLLRGVPSPASAVLAIVLSVSACAPPAREEIPLPPGGGEPEVSFRDVLDGSGVDFEHRVFAGPDKAFPETMGAGGAWLDYDGDGNLDLFLVQGKPWEESEPGEDSVSRLYRGHGDGSFVDVTKESGLRVHLYGMGATVGDADNNGFPDLLVTGYPENRLYLNRGGVFEDATDAAGLRGGGWSVSAAFLDFDSDGDLDLYVARYLDWSEENNPVCSPRDGLRVYCHPDNFGGVTDLVYRNEGGARFVEVGADLGIAIEGGSWEAKGLGVEVADWNGDGHADIYVANDSTRNYLFLGDGEGGFEDASLRSGAGYNQLGETEAGMGVDHGDVDGDGYPDIFVTNLDGETNTLYRNQNGDLFRDVTFERGLAADSVFLVGFGAAFLDMDRDRDLDLFVTNGHILDNVRQFRPDRTHAQPLLLYENDGTGAFRNIAPGLGGPFAGSYVGRAAAPADFDNDGDPDLLVTTNGGRPLLLRNDTVSSRHWLGVQVRGVRSNRDGIGAMVSVRAAGGTQSRFISTAGGYASAVDGRALFGLGESDAVEMLEVRWPSGETDRIPGPPVDRYLHVEEGRGLLDADSFRRGQRP